MRVNVNLFKSNVMIKCSCRRFLALLVAVWSLLGLQAQDGLRPRGDVNRDFVVDIDDVNAVLNVMVRKTPYDADADLDGSGVVDIDDLNSIINIIVRKAE